MAVSHPFYVSLCKVDYNAVDQSFEISVKIFADDLLAALSEKGFDDLYLGEEKENPKTGEHIFNYLKENLFIKTDDKPCTFTFIGKEMDDDAVWCYLEARGVSPFNTIEITNRILTEIFETQNNIVQVNKNGRILSLLLKRNNTTGRLNFG
jgi:hypothetical protein